MAKASFFALCFLPLLIGCGPGQQSKYSAKGTWLIELAIDGHSLPFIAHIANDTFSLKNGTETLFAESIVLKGDSISIRLAVFNSLIKAKLTSDSTLTGEFIDRSREGDYRIPLKGSKGIVERFVRKADPTTTINGSWSVSFSPGTKDSSTAIGEFRQRGGIVEGTFLTPTGDFRFLEGVVSGDSVMLSAFDGSHAYLFRAKVMGDSISGMFWSGTHWKEPWTAARNENAQLPDSRSLTFLKPGHDRLTFSFPDLSGNLVSLEDERFQNKVVIVQIMGSWCPNCMDESAYLAQLFNKHHSNGLEIVALAFERKAGEPGALENLERMRDHFSIKYPILLAGNASKKEAAEKLPMLNHVMAFPTTVILDRGGKVRHIHTGFMGPGTGIHYQQFVVEMETLLTELLNEKSVS